MTVVVRELIVRAIVAEGGNDSIQKESQDNSKMKDIVDREQIQRIVQGAISESARKQKER